MSSSRCTHPNIGFSKTKVFDCQKCGNKCKFCNICKSPFTEKTINKYDGFCGYCFKKIDQEEDDEEDEEDENNDGDDDEMDEKFIQKIEKELFQQLSPLIVIMSTPSRDMEESSNKSVKKIEKTDRTLVQFSKLHENNDKEQFAKGKYIIKNILAEDKVNNKVLVEWKNDEYATWENYNDIKNTKAFQVYVGKSK